MLKFEKGEEWKEIKLPRAYKIKKRYAVSNHGRLVSFTTDIHKGKIMNNTTRKGYKILMYRCLENNTIKLKAEVVHRLVAEYFIPNKPQGEVFVLHLDFNKGNNHISNLKWGNKRELLEHHKKNPAVIESNKKRAEWLQNRQLQDSLKRAEANRFYPGEEWKELSLPDKLHFRYAVSNFGRMLSFSTQIENGRIMKLGKRDGYTVFPYKTYHDGKISNKTLFIRKLVAEYFLAPPEPEQIFVLLLDRNRSNNRVSNLKWATKEAMLEHSRKSPYVIKARMNKKHQGVKLTSTQVHLIKQKLADPNRKTRLKMIAKQFGITTMTLQRIKTGENWAHIKIQRKDNQKYIMENDGTNRQGLN